MKRPDRRNYPNGVFGDISYDERLERYCSYLENQNKRLRIASVVWQSEQLPQDKFCKVCNLPTDGEKCYSKRCPV